MAPNLNEPLHQTLHTNAIDNNEIKYHFISLFCGADQVKTASHLKGCPSNRTKKKIKAVQMNVRHSLTSSEETMMASKAT